MATDPYWPVHAHSEYSALDGMGSVFDMVTTVESLGQPGLALTDHGNMAGALRLYKECRKQGITPFPGEEFYLVTNAAAPVSLDGGPDPRKQRFHIGMLALNVDGFRALLKLSSRSHLRERFHQKPLIDLADLAALGQAHGNDVAVTSGCYFGWVIQNMLLVDDMQQRVTRATALLSAITNMGFQHLFVELQNHNIVHDNGDTDISIASALHIAAARLGLPCVIGQDSHYCTEMSEPLLMADLSYKPIGEVVVGDKVLGWHRPDGKSNKVATAAEVTHVMHREAEAVKMTFESGATVVCTPDHNWMQYGPWKAGIDRWGALSVGSEAVRITMPREVPAGMERDAGWLGGMYDGEGSRQGIAQSTTANPEVCERIEWTLEALGFNYAVQDNGAGTNVYRIKGGDSSARGVNLWVDFINIAQPTKHHWITDRVVDRRLRAMGPDRVVSIEPVGIKTVVSLTTTTGNYISAGLASKNCDHADQPAHDTMKSIAYHGGDGEDAKFPGDGFHLADAGWLRQHWPDHIWNDAMDGHDHLLDLNTLRIPELDSYKFCVPSVVRDPMAELRSKVDLWNDADKLPKCAGGIDALNRVTEELAVIEAKDMAGYFLLVADYMQWCRDEGIFVNARGSANGSLVCFLLGITNVDPMEWGTDFDRFLSLDRAKPPDIDMDIESDRRDDVIGYLKARYPSMVQLGTWLRMGSSSDEEEKGSVFVQWHAANRRRDGYTGHIPEEEVLRLRLLDDLDVRKGHGAHAGGFVIPGDWLAVEDFLATMLIPSSNLTVTQAPMDDVEEVGFVKLDLLGLRSLTTMRRAMELIGKDPIVDGMGWIPNDDAEACKILRSGTTENGIFQFEGFSTAKGARKMGVRSTIDATIALALFRPAMMHSGMTDRYLEARKARQRVSLHPTVDDLFDTTYGVPVFQEDVLGLLKRVGLDASDRNDMLKAVKMSNDRIAVAEATFARIERVFVARATSTLPGVSVDDAQRMWATVLEFTDYGFNRAHATAYGLMGYRMAYLKAHYPLEFMCALLSTWAGTDKEAKYIAEARRMGIVIRKPDVNASSVSWTIDGKALRKGLLTIKGVGVNAATAIVDNAPFTDLDDLCARVPARAVTGAKAWQKESIFKGTLEKLRDAAALRSLGVDA